MAAFDGPSPKTPYRRKNIAEISYASRVIATFVPNFVAMETGVNRGKMRLAAFDGPSPKTLYRRKNIAKISYASRIIANFVPNFVKALNERKWAKFAIFGQYVTVSQ